jgi:ribosome-binding factor A
MSARRKRRIEELIQQEISDLILRDLRDPRLGLVTITDVDLTPDLKLARVYFTAMDEEAELQSLEALQHAAGFLQHGMGARIRLRFTPKLEFRVDSSLQRGLRIEALLNAIRTEDESARHSSPLQGSSPTHAVSPEGQTDSQDK